MRLAGGVEAGAGLLSFLLPEISRSFELSVPLFENLLLMAVQLVGRRNAANGAEPPSEDGAIIR